MPYCRALIATVLLLAQCATTESLSMTMKNAVATDGSSYKLGNPTRRQAIAFLTTVPALIGSSKSTHAYEPDPDPVKESLYLISRVQEATVQQERFVRKASDGLALKNKMKLTLLLIEKNYKLVDQITYCSTYLPSENLVEATEAGNEAAEELQSAIDFVRNDLKAGPLDQKQKDYITDALSNTREKLFVFLDFMPQGKLEEARKRVEEENKLNIEEFDGDEDAGVYNPVILPWKNRTV